MREGFLVEWDQSTDAALEILVEACRKVLATRQELAVRGLVDAVNRQTAGMLTKKGEPRPASLFIKERLGGTKKWLQTLPSEFVIVGEWPRVSLRRSRPSREDLAVGAVVRGSCAFWDKARGWGKLVVDGSDVKVFAHCNDLQTGDKRLERGARVRFVVARADRGYAATMIVDDTMDLDTS